MRPLFLYLTLLALIILASGYALVIIVYTTCYYQILHIHGSLLPDAFPVLNLQSQGSILKTHEVQHTAIPNNFTADAFIQERERTTSGMLASRSRRYREFCYTSKDRHKPEIDSVFSSFFENDDVVDFRRRYVTHYLNRTNNNGLFGYVLQGTTGFGSVINNALHAYVIASRPEVDRVFQMFQFDWKYTQLREIFEDFAENSSYPLFPLISNKSDQDLFLNKSEDFNLLFVNHTTSIGVIVNGSAELAVRYQHTNQSFYLHHMVRIISDVEGVDTVFATKSAMVRALWNPKPDLKAVLKKLWCALLAPSGDYFAMHIRRGDKIAAEEMEYIELETYYDALEDICRSRVKPCPKKLFLMYDDREAYLAMKYHARRRFEVVDLSDLLFEIGDWTKEYISPLGGSDLHQVLPGNFSDWLWKVHSKELVISITLLAMAEHLVCTFSSNICRLVAELRGDYTQNFVHSLDVDWFPL